MDLATAVAGFVSLGLQISQNLLTYYDGWRHSREDVDDICNSVGEMRQMLTIMDEAVKRQSFHSCNGTDDFKRTVERCENTMSRLERKVKKVRDDTATSGFLARARSEFERVKYPLKESTILKLRDLLREQKLDLVLILNGLNMWVISVPFCSQILIDYTILLVMHLLLDQRLSLSTCLSYRVISLK